MWRIRYACLKTFVRAFGFSFLLGQMEIIPPSGYVSLTNARDILMQRMHRGLPPSETVKAFQENGLHVVDGEQTTAAAKVLRQAILDGQVALFAIFSSRDTPMRLHDRGLIEAAAFPPHSKVLTFAYCARHPKAPFGLSSSELNELTGDPLCVDKKQFERWMRSEERKKAWPCHFPANETRNLPGRPALMGEVIDVIAELMAKGELSPSDPIKVVHDRVQRARPSMHNISQETVRRARNALLSHSS